MIRLLLLLLCLNMYHIAFSQAHQIYSDSLGRGGFEALTLSSGNQLFIAHEIPYGVKDLARKTVFVAKSFNRNLMGIGWSDQSWSKHQVQQYSFAFGQSFSLGFKMALNVLYTFNQFPESMAKEQLSITANAQQRFNKLLVFGALKRAMKGASKFKIAGTYPLHENINWYSEVNISQNQFFTQHSMSYLLFKRLMLSGKLGSKFNYCAFDLNYGWYNIHIKLIVEMHQQLGWSNGIVLNWEF